MAYQQFDAENTEVFQTDAALESLLTEAKQYYKVSSLVPTRGSRGKLEYLGH